MARYLITFQNGAMDHLTEELWPEVGRESHAVVQELREAGALRFAGGFDYGSGLEPAVVETDGTVMDGPFPETKELIGGVTIIDVATREEALMWAGKIAKACRCAQDVRRFMDDPDLVE